MKIINWLLNRTFILYLLFGAFVFISFDLTEAQNSAKLSVLNRLFPEFGYLAKKGSWDEDDYLKNQKRSIYYYQKVVDFMPSRFDALSMLGFSYYEIGDEASSIQFYEKAIQASSRTFWPFYNLGVIYFNKGDYQTAQEYFQQALQTNPRENIGLLLTTKIYSQFHGGNTVRQREMVESLGYGYEHAHILLNFSQQFINYPAIKDVPFEAVLNKLGVEDKIKKDFFTQEGKGVVRIF